MMDQDRKPAPVLVHRARDEDDDEEQFKPLDWGLVRRLLTYARPVQRKLNIMFVLTVVRAAQLPALVWLTALVIKGPIAHGDLAGIRTGTLAFVALAVMTDSMFHFRQRYALEIEVDFDLIFRQLYAQIFAPVDMRGRVKIRFYGDKAIRVELGLLPFGAREMDFRERLQRRPL